MSLTELARIKQWHIRHRMDHPVEYHLWDVMLTVWMMGWIGWVPTFVLDAVWATPLCMAAMAAPTLYVTWRLKAHRERRLRCDWAAVVA